MCARDALIDNTVIEQVYEFIEQNVLIRQRDTLVIGLSGGPDSVFLLHALVALRPSYNLTLIAAHLDHGWRPESAQDALFCKELAESLGITYVGKHAQALALPPWTGSREELGRTLRRTFLENVAHEYSAQAIVLGHHKDDQIETFFVRLMRGAGLAGLSGMRPRSGLYIRPLLGVFKEQILEYLHEKGFAYRQDYTNESPLYLRNRLRNLVIPELKKSDPRFANNCIRSIGHLQEAADFLEQLTKTTFDTIASYQEDRYVIDLKSFRQLDPFMKKQVLLTWLCREKLPFTPTSAFFDEALRFLNTQRGGSHTLHPTWHLIKQGNLAFVQKIGEF